MEAECKREADWPHWPDRASGRSHRDRLERGLFRDSEREAVLTQAEAAIRQLGEVTQAKIAEVERLQRAVEAANGHADAAFLAFAWTPGGYALREERGSVPAVGARIAVDGGAYVVVKLARSPLPSDQRFCVYLEPVRAEGLDRPNP